MYLGYAVAATYWERGERFNAFGVCMGLMGKKQGTFPFFGLERGDGARRKMYVYNTSKSFTNCKPNCNLNLFTVKQGGKTKRVYSPRLSKFTYVQYLENDYGDRVKTFRVCF